MTLYRLFAICDHLRELQLSYGLLEDGDIDKFEAVATEADLVYIDKLVSACTKWTFRNSEKDPERLRRDEIKCLQRVAYRLKKHGKS